MPSRPACRARTVRFASTISRVQNVSARLTSCVTASAAPAPVRFLPEQREAVQLLIDVEKRRRLVEQHHLRLLRQARGQEHALPFAAAQRPERPPAELEALAAPHRLERELVVVRPTRTSRPHARTAPSAPDLRRASRRSARRLCGRCAARRARPAGVKSSSGRSAEQRPRRGQRRRMPAMMSSSVLLPAPLRPMIATNSPGATSKLTPSRIGVDPRAPADVTHFQHGHRVT